MADPTRNRHPHTERMPPTVTVPLSRSISPCENAMTPTSWKTRVSEQAYGFKS
jgi:hypothetical protein